MTNTDGCYDSLDGGHGGVLDGDHVGGDSGDDDGDKDGDDGGSDGGHDKGNLW